MPRRGVRFRCPLCHAHGATATLEADLERDVDAMVVVDLRGCPHAEGFGDPEQLSFDDEWRLITAALDAFERPRPVRRLF
jgi:hypothetical protein